jgi:membrane-associated protease RseP (regulator of RpoE activity)
MNDFNVGSASERNSDGSAEDTNADSPVPGQFRPDLFRAKPSPDRIWLHVLLFILTLLSTTASYVLWVGYGVEGFADLLTAGYLRQAVWFSVPLLLFLTVHEFGHYFAAKIHKVSATLPFYIPLPFLGIGTLGAVIRIREPIPSLRKLFDIGVAGPLAGFVAVFIMLIVAFATLPEVDHVARFDGHDSLKAFVAATGEFPPELIREEGAEPGTVPVVGETVLFYVVGSFFDNVPPMYEMYHYPFLFACWLGLFFTALNMLPVGQLDGGHVLFALVGPVWHARLARGFVLFLLLSGSIGYGAIDPAMFGNFAVVRWPFLALLLYVLLNRTFAGDQRTMAPALAFILLIAFAVQAFVPSLLWIGYSGWLIWSFLIVFVLGVDHPPVLYSQPLTSGQRVLSIVSFIIFVVCFSFRPFYYL